MKLKPILLTLALLSCSYSQYDQGAIAENLENINRALSTNKCQSCDLRTSNLVYAKLSGADLSFSNLREANLSRADLSFSNLRNADFRGASLFGANLNGADLSGANLSSVDLSGVNFNNANLQGTNFSGSDLRRAFFGGANLTGVNFSNALLRGAVGIPIAAVSPQEYYAWATDEDKKGNHRQAIEYFNNAVIIDPKYALAYMGRAISLKQIGDVDSAVQDSDRAAALFEAQGNEKGQKLAKNLSEVMKNPPGASGGGFGDVVTSLGSFLLQFLLR